MRDLKPDLERASERFDLEPGALERMFERRHQRHRRQRVTALVVAVAISVGVGGVIAGLGGLRTGGSPSQVAGTAASMSRLIGTWQTGRLSQRQIVDAFVAAGGSRREGRAFFAQLGQGSTSYAVITIRFDGDSFAAFESGDGGPPVAGYHARTRMSAEGVLTLGSSGCTGAYTTSVVGDVLRLRVLKQCDRHDGPYNTTLFASFPFSKTG